MLSAINDLGTAVSITLKDNKFRETTVPILILDPLHVVLKLKFVPRLCSFHIIKFGSALDFRNILEISYVVVISN